MQPYEKLIVITDRSLCSGDFPSQIRKALALRPPALILRERDLSDRDYLVLARDIQAFCRDAQVPFFVHSRIEVARELGCPNLHLPLPALAAMGKKPEGFACVSASSHGMEDMRQAVRLGADRIILGTIFQTECKKGLPGKGLLFLKEVCAACPVPVYAIGGIKVSNMEAVLAAGAAGGCMMSGYMETLPEPDEGVHRGSHPVGKRP